MGFVTPTILPARTVGASTRCAQRVRLGRSATTELRLPKKRTRCVSMTGGPANNSEPNRKDAILDGPFEGHFGTWHLTQGDVDGVLVYRGSLAVCAALTAVGVALGVLRLPTPPHLLDATFFGASIAFGVALQTIHIYMKPMHNLIKGLWVVGFIGAVVLTASPFLPSHSVYQAIIEYPELLLAVGWQFVAMTGLFFKEAICFGRPEALALFGLVPILSGGHFLHLLSPAVERYGLVSFAVIFLFFSARKFLQAPRDDLGDKSVFDHLERGGTLS